LIALEYNFCCDYKYIALYSIIPSGENYKMPPENKKQQIFKQLNITGSKYENAEVESIVKATISVTAGKIFDEIEMKCGKLWIDTLKKSAKYHDLKKEWRN